MDLIYDKAGKAARQRLNIKLLLADERYENAVALAATRSRIARLKAYNDFDKEGEKAVNARLRREAKRNG
jgi:hypothetical protein